MNIEGNIIDIHNRTIYPGIIKIKGKKVDRIERSSANYKYFILPGLVDSHIHIESSMVTPVSFAEAAVSRGTTAVVSDPHEIANVLGNEGVLYMLEDARRVPLKFFFGAPSCVPATSYESSGAVVDSIAVETLVARDDIKYLAEMMNYPGVVNKDPEVMRKIAVAGKYKKPVDGHAPGLTGKDLRDYIAAGISTDHECTGIEEAREKIALGMKIMIREGSAAKNLDELKLLYKTNPGMLMLCSDDLHPEMLVKQHINKLVARLISEGYDIYDVIRSCTVNPVQHYRLEAGLLRPGDPADLILVDEPSRMNVVETWINGRKVYDNGKVLFDYKKSTPLNKFNCSRVSKDDVRVVAKGRKLRVIVASDGSLLTGETIREIGNKDYVQTNTTLDILKIVVKDRYEDKPPAVGYIRGFGLQRGAFASSVAHDSHNIICVGVEDSDIADAINAVVEMKGGLAVADGNNISSLPLPVAGIMSNEPVARVALKYEQLSGLVKRMGCKLSAPFMTLSFMALLVIPELKISDLGIFDGREFRLTSLFAD